MVAALEQAVGSAASLYARQRPRQSWLPTHTAFPRAEGSRNVPPPRSIHMRVICRIDYHLATPALAALARNEHIYKDKKFLDPAPLTIDYALDF